MSFSCVNLLPHSRGELRNWWLDNISSLDRNEQINHMIIKLRPSPTEAEHMPDGSLVSMEVIGFYTDSNCQIAIIRCRRVVSGERAWYPLIMATVPGYRRSYSEKFLETNRWQRLNPHGHRPSPRLFGIVERHGESFRPRPVYSQSILDIVYAIDSQLPILEDNAPMKSIGSSRDSTDSESSGSSKRFSESEKNEFGSLSFLSIEVEDIVFDKNVFHTLQQRMQNANPSELDRLSRMTLDRLEWAWMKCEDHSKCIIESGSLDFLATVLDEFIVWEERDRTDQRLHSAIQKQLLLEKEFMKRLNHLNTNSAHSTEVDHKKAIGTYMEKFQNSNRNCISLIHNKLDLEKAIETATFCKSAFRYFRIQRMVDLIFVQIASYPNEDFLRFISNEDYVYLKLLLVHASSESLEQHMDTFLTASDLGPAKNYILAQTLCRRQSPTRKLVDADKFM